LVSEHSRRMMEMQSNFGGMNLGMSFDEEKTLIINDKNPIIQKILSIKSNEEKDDKVELICNQIVDLALLSNKELKPEELELFVKRSNKLMSMVISL
ncbi:MAG: molecular chaperone HtpG, partial [Romboutsia sp.]